MAGPQLDTDGGEDEDSGDSVVADFDGSEDASGNDGDVIGVGEADLGLDDDNGLVDGFDGFEGEDTSSDSDDTTSSGSSTGGPEISSAIEEGMAEVAVVGLTGRDRKRVRSEMQAIASQFKLGYFGEKCVQKYLKKDLSEIPPEYGLAASMVAFLAVAMYKRPDGKQKASQAFTALKSKFTSNDPEPEPEPGTSDDSDSDTDSDTEEESEDDE